MENCCKKKVYSGIGGQAVLEGIMMKNKEEYSVACRLPDKTIKVEKYTYKSILDKCPIFKWPFIRGTFSLIDSMIIGIQRGIFSNESGLGTGAIAASTVDIDYNARQGYIQMLGIYITTFLVCTSTAIVILTSNIDVTGPINGIEMTQQAFIYHIGNFGNIIVIISIILFAFSTILSGYYDNESNLKYLFPNINKFGIYVFKLMNLSVILLGSIMSAEILWQIVNIVSALLAIINFYGIMNLKEDVFNELSRYKKYVKIK